jgi:hypothetical protein
MRTDSFARAQLACNVRIEGCRPMATTSFHFCNAQEQAASMCRTGSCCGNGVAKSLFRSRQKVCSQRQVYQTREGANADIFESGAGL